MGVPLQIGSAAAHHEINGVLVEFDPFAPLRAYLRLWEKTADRTAQNLRVLTLQTAARGNPALAWAFREATAVFRVQRTMAAFTEAALGNFCSIALRQDHVDTEESAVFDYEKFKGLLGIKGTYSLYNYLSVEGDVQAQNEIKLTVIRPLREFSIQDINADTKDGISVHFKYIDGDFEPVGYSKVHNLIEVKVMPFEDTETDVQTLFRTLQGLNEVGL